MDTEERRTLAWDLYERASLASIFGPGVIDLDVFEADLTRWREAVPEDAEAEEQDSIAMATEVLGQLREDAEKIAAAQAAAETAEANA